MTFTLIEAYASGWLNDTAARSTYGVALRPGGPASRHDHRKRI